MKVLARQHLESLVVSWDNFDYNQTVRHQTLANGNQHFCATTGKLCIGHYIPITGLQTSMLDQRVLLSEEHIFQAPINDQTNGVYIACQQYWIAEAIRYVHREAVKSVFHVSGKQELYPQFPAEERLQHRRTPHVGLGPLMENEGTIQGTYRVIEKVFQEQLGLQEASDFEQRLMLVYGDQKTVGLVNSVQVERRYSRDSYGRFQWILPIPGLFHWRTNFIGLMFDTYSGNSHFTERTTLSHNANFLGCKQGFKSTFHHQEEVITKAFDARVLAMFYFRIRDNCDIKSQAAIDRYISSLTPETFNLHVEDIRQSIFTRRAQHPAKGTAVDHEHLAHARFINHVETYKTLKHAIKVGDIGLIERLFPRCALLFFGGNKTRYGHLSLYMTWLTQSGAASSELRKALLANGLVNLRGASESWFEMDRLNEFMNLEMRNAMGYRRTSTQDLNELFRRTALTASFCTNLQAEIGHLSSRHTESAHTVTDASDDVYHLAYDLYASRSVTHFQRGRESKFKPADLVSRTISRRFDEKVSHFNSGNFDEAAMEGNETVPIHELDHIVGESDI